MKRLLMIIFAVILFSLPVFADSYEELEESGQIVEVDMENELPLYIRAGVGLKIERLQLDLDKINGLLAAADVDFSALDETMMLYGIEGVGGVRNGNIYGAYFLNGRNRSRGANGERVELSLTYGGLIYQRGIYMKKNTDISIGTGMGYGRSRLELLHYKVDATKDGILGATGTTLEKSFLLLEPSINFHQQLTPIIGLDFSVGYLMTHDLDGGWSLSGHELEDSLDGFEGGSVSLRVNFGM
ncbi:hypothetical protein [Orenia metallireducens]|nr:hypothetical protein [Orenia metallireducens]